MLYCDEGSGCTMNKKIIEVCCNSVADCITAQKAGADRIELNNAVYLGGLTPTLQTLLLAKQHVDIPIVVMIRPRGGGFSYSPLEIEQMKLEAISLLDAGADGIVFGFLNNDKTIDKQTTKEMVDIAHRYCKEAIFHRAIDVVEDMAKGIEDLIDCNVDRILTSGGHATSHEGIHKLKALFDSYKNKIEFCVGAGVHEDNIKEIYDTTGIHQLHGSFKMWFEDPTTQGPDVSYAYSDSGSYEGVSKIRIQKAKKALNQ